MREGLPLSWLVRRFLVTLAIAGAIGTVGPFGTFGELGALDRYAYWFTIVVLNWLQILAFAALIGGLPIAAGWRAPLVVAAGCLAASVPAGFEVWWLERYFRPDATLPGPVVLYGYVLVLSLVIAVPLAELFVPPRARGEEASVPAAALRLGPPAPAPFLKRLPSRLGSELLCLQAEDHYLRVHTPLGNDLMLCRLSDAMAELGGLEGLQVHRSYWVARAAVVGVERNGKKLALRLANGLDVPVSRTFLRGLRSAGWLG